jgi:hypothetical protein
MEFSSIKKATEIDHIRSPKKTFRPFKNRHPICTPDFDPKPRPTKSLDEFP